MNDSTSATHISTLFQQASATSIRDNVVGASLGDVWLEASSWNGVAALLDVDDLTARRGLASFFADRHEQVDDSVWRDLLQSLMVELEQ